MMRNTKLTGLYWMVAIVGVIFLLAWLTHHNDYHITATYCGADGHCAYRETTVNGPNCPEWWDNSGAFDKVNNLKLESGTCKAVK